jgi:RHS repeat-associated protein
MSIDASWRPLGRLGRVLCSHAANARLPHRRHRGLGLAVVALALALACPQLAAAATYRDAVAGTTGLQGYWRLSETFGTTAVAVKGPNGTYGTSPVLGVPSLLRSDGNFAADFDTQGDAVRVLDQASLDFTSAFTLEAWVRLDVAPAATRYLMCKDGAYCLAIDGQRNFQAWRTTAGVRATVSTARADRAVLDAVHHVVATYDSAQLKLYVDGHLADAIPVTGSVDVKTTDLYLGARAAANSWEGVLDEPAVYSVALSEAQVRDHYEAGADGTPPAPPAAVTATAGDGEVVLDWRGSGDADAAAYRVLRSAGGAPHAQIAPDQTATSFRDTAVTNGTTYSYVVQAVDTHAQTSGADPVSATPAASTRYRDAVLAHPALQSYWRLGEAAGATRAVALRGDDGALRGAPAGLGAGGLLARDSNAAADLDGADDWIAVPDSDAVEPADTFAVEAWARPDAASGGVDRRLVCKSAAYCLAMGPDGTPYVRAFLPGGEVVAKSASPLAVGSRYHLVGSYDRQRLRLYVNGTEVASAAATGRVTQNASELGIGSGTGPDPWNGAVDEVAVYGDALSAEDVRTHYDVGTDGTPPAAPAGVTATAGDGLVSLDWADNAEADLAGYDVYRTSATGGAEHKVNERRLSASRFTDFAVTNGTTYRYVVRATNKVGRTSAPSAQVTGAPRLASSYGDAVAATSSLRAYWRLGEVNGGFAKAEKGPEGEHMNDPVLGVPGLLAADPNKAISPRASNSSYVRVPDDAALDVSGAWTLEAWVKPTAWYTGTATTGGVVGKGDAYELALAKDGRWTVHVRSAGVWRQWTFTQAALNRKEHVAVSYDGTTLRFYVNGALAGSATSLAPDVGTGRLWMGGFTDANQFTGDLDEVAVYGAPLSAAIVKEHYDVGADGTAPAKPTGLTAVASSGSVALNWVANQEADLSGYDVLRATTSGGPYQRVSPTRLTASAFTDTELENGKALYYVVKAVDKAGNASPASAEVKATPTSAPVLAEPDTLHANGAELRWSRFDTAKDGPFEAYEVHRSTSPGFAPGAATLLARIPDRLITTYRDTTAAAGKAYTYKLTANGRASGEWPVTLPQDGQSRKVLQPDAAAGRATYVREGSCANRGADGALRVGTTADSKVRGLVAFDVSDIPSDATITSSRLSLYTAYVPGEPVTIAAHRATTAWEEGDGNGTCGAEGATWTESDSGEDWNRPGGDFAASGEGTVTRPAGSTPGWDDYAITDLTRRWVSGEAPNFGVVLKATDETLLAGKMTTYHADGAATPPSLRPRLIVDYADGSRSQAPEVKVTAPIGGDRVKGTAVKVTADAGDDRRVENVEFFAGSTSLGTDQTAPYEATWNSTASANGAQTLKAVATDDAGNATTSAGRDVAVINSAAPTTSVEPPSASYASAVRADDPIAYYRLGESSGASVMTDSSGNGRDGTYAGGGTTLGLPGLTRDGDTAASVDPNAGEPPRTSALNAPGVSSSSRISVEAWIDLEAHTAEEQYDHVVERGWSHDGYWGTSDGRWVLYTSKFTEGHTYACFDVSKAATGNNGVCARAPDGRLHLVATYDGETARMYVNGLLVGSRSMPGYTLTTSVDVRLGNGASRAQKLDDVSIYDDVLGPAAVQQHYDAAGLDSYASTVQADAPAGWWRFAETSGTTIADATGAGRSAALSGDVVLGQGTLLGRGSGDSAALLRANTTDGRATVNGLGGLLGSRFTAEAWVDYTGPTGPDEWMQVMSRGWSGTGGWYVGVYSSSRAYGGQQGTGFWVDGGGTPTRTVAAVQPGRLHVVATYDGTTLRYYVNGEEVDWAQLPAAALTTTAPLIIGGNSDTGNQLTIDEVAVYPEALNEHRVRAHYAAGRARAIAGDTTIKATAADDGSVGEVQFYVDGSLFDTDTAAPYEATLSTLSDSERTYDGSHVVTTKTIDDHGNMTTSAPQNVVVANASPRAQAHIGAGDVPAAVSWDPDPGAVQQQQTIDVAVSNLGDRTLAADDTDVRYRWVRPDGSTAATGDTPLPASAAPNTTVTATLKVQPPALVEGVERAKHQLQFDLVDKSTGAVLSAKGNRPDDRPVDVMRTDVSLGLERWHQYDGEELGGGMQHLLNVASGNSLVRFTPFSSPGRGLSTVVDLTYNALEDKSTSPAGNNWSLAISSLTRFGTPLDVHPNKADKDLPKDYVDLVDGDGTAHRFIGKAAADGTRYREEPAGVHLYLREYSTTDKARKWALTRPDRTTFFYDTEGWPTSVEDANGNRITFTIQRIPPGEDPGGPRYRITKVTDAGGRSFDLGYYSKADADAAHVRGKVKRIADHTGSALDFEYYDDGNLRRLVQRGATNDGIPAPDRAWVFTYTTSDGSGAALTDPAQRQDPPRHVGNQSTRIYSVRDPNGKETLFAYEGNSHPDKRWRVTERIDRAGARTTFGYDAAARQTTIARPESRTTRFDYDARGQVTKIVDPLQRQTSLVWSADRHVTSVTEPGNAGEAARVRDFEYDANGYLMKLVDRREGTRTTTLAYDYPAADTGDPTGTKDAPGKWKTGRNVAHVSQLKSVTTPRQTTSLFEYDKDQTTYSGARGNLTSVTDPEGSKSRFDYNADGTISRTTDPRGNATTISYDANGLPTVIQEPESRTTRMGYDADGLLRWVQDPNHAGEPSAPAGCDGPEDARDYRTCFEYDGLHRLRRQSTPKSTVHERDELIWSSVEYDANDNVMKSYAPAKGQEPVTGSLTTNEYDPMDRVTETLAPSNGNRDGIPNLTTVRYDAAGRPDRVTLPKGNATTAYDNDHATFLGYDLLDRVTRQTRFGNGKTFRTRYCYDDAGDLRSVTLPEGDRADFACGPYGNGTHTWKADYFRDHRAKSTIDPEGKSRSVEYDANGNVSRTLDEQGTPTRYEYNGRDDVTKVVQKFSATQELTSKTEYDEAGNVIRSISPRAWSKKPDLASYAGEEYVTSYTYDGLDRVTRVQLPDDASADTTQAYVHTRYDPNGNATLRTQPTDKADLAGVDDQDKVNVGFFDTGWVRSKDEGPLPAVRYDYRAEGWQTLRTATAGDGRTKTSRRRYFPDGQLAERDGPDRQTNTYEYDGNGNVVKALATIGTHDEAESAKTIRAFYDGLDRVIDSREQRREGGDWRVGTLEYNLNSEVVKQVDDASSTTETGTPTGGRSHTYRYLQNGWLDVHHDYGTDTGAGDDRKVNYQYTATGSQKQRVISRWAGTGFAARQTTDVTHSLNGLPLTEKTYKGSDPTDQTAVRESHDLEYFVGTEYLNGHRVKDTFKRSNPDSSKKCEPSAGVCVRTYSYDARDRVAKDHLAVPGDEKWTQYTLDPAGNVEQLKVQGLDGPTHTTDYDYAGNQLREAIPDVGERSWYRYDPFGNLDCVGTGTRDESVCATWNDATPASKLAERYRYDDLDRVRRTRKFRDGKVTGRSRTIYDALDRPVLRREGVDAEKNGVVRDKTTTFTYRGLSDLVVRENRKWIDPPAVGDARWKDLTRQYSYDANGARVGMTAQRDGAPEREFTYGYDDHGSVSLLLNENGDAKGAYGYDAYGKKDEDLTAERDSDLPDQKPLEGDPLNPYGYDAKRSDHGAGTLDMGARHFSPDTGRFLQDDMYEDALGDLGLSEDPLTSNRYALAAGNPVSFVEVDGHGVCPRIKECGGRKAASEANGNAAQSAASGGGSATTATSQGTPSPRLVRAASRLLGNVGYDAAGNRINWSELDFVQVDLERTRDAGARRLTGEEQALDGSVWPDLMVVTAPVAGALRNLGRKVLGGVFGGGSRGASVAAIGAAANSTLRTAADPVEDALLTHLVRAVDQLKQQGLTRAQRTALTRRPHMEPLFRGERIDHFVRESVRRDPALRHLRQTPRGQRGPDFIDPRNGRWYDITTPGAWRRHVDRYAPNWGPDGVGIVYK